MMSYPNILLVAGSGRNVGKTSLVCSIIHKFRNHHITAIKVSPHRHKLDTNHNLLIENGMFQVIVETKSEGYKDSSRMLKAGAEKVLYIQCDDQYIEAAFRSAMNFIDVNGLLVVESGGMRRILKPGMFLFLTAFGTAIKNGHLDEYADLVVNMGVIKVDAVVNRIEISDNHWKLKVGEA